MLKECRYLDSEKIINITLFLTIENENRYIIDCYDIARFLKIITENLKKQNLDIIEGREPICQNDNFEIYNDEESESTYYLLYPWLDIKAFATSFAGTLSNEVIKACYQDNLYQNLPPRSDEDLEKLNKIYQKFIDKKEEENTQQSEFYNYRKISSELTLQTTDKNSSLYYFTTRKHNDVFPSRCKNKLQLMGFPRH